VRNAAVAIPRRGERKAPRAEEADAMGRRLTVTRNVDQAVGVDNRGERFLQAPAGVELAW